MSHPACLYLGLNYAQRFDAQWSLPAWSRLRKHLWRRPQPDVRTWGTASGKECGGLLRSYGCQDVTAACWTLLLPGALPEYQPLLVFHGLTKAMMDPVGWIQLMALSYPSAFSLLPDADFPAVMIGHDRKML